MEQPDHSAVGLVPNPDRLRGRQQLDLAFFSLEIGRCLVREHYVTLLSSTNYEIFCAFLIDVLGFVQRNGVRGAVDGLGQFFLPFFHFPFSRTITSYSTTFPSMVIEPNSVSLIRGLILNLPVFELMDNMHHSVRPEEELRQAS